jgi:hypothetical protein
MARDMTMAQLDDEGVEAFDQHVILRGVPWSVYQRLDEPTSTAAVKRLRAELRRR